MLLFLFNDLFVCLFDLCLLWFSRILALYRYQANARRKLSKQPANAYGASDKHRGTENWIRTFDFIDQESACRNYPAP